MTAALAALQSLFEARDGCAYRAGWEESTWGLDFYVTPNLQSPLAEQCKRVLVETARSKRFGFYDPLRPEPSQRNRVLSWADLIASSNDRDPPMKSALQRGGVGADDQLRVLVCDGASLLAWVGFFREEAFGAREKQLLLKVLPALRAQLRFDREVRRNRLLEAGLSTAMEALGAPAFLLDSKGRIVGANSLGGASREKLRDLRSVGRGVDSKAYDVFSVRAPGMPDHRLVVASSRRQAASTRLAAAAARWGLTRRQGEVLALLVRGMTNKQIAEELRCAEGTVELHVTAILRKSGVESRVEALAKFWHDG